MNLFEKLTETDKEYIERYIAKYARGPEREGHTVGSPASLDYILREWNLQKENLYNLFGKKFIIKKEIEISKSINEIASEFADAIDNDDRIYPFYNEYRNFLRNQNRNTDSVFYDYSLYRTLCDLVDPECLARNKFTGENCSFEYKGKKFSLQNGAKIIKTLQKLVELFELDQDKFETFRLAQSLYTNQRKIKGTLVFSIHPLDYMTMSDNNTWSSCMSWKDTGCYCRGTVEMMNSPIVLVAYLESKEKYDLFDYGDDCFWSNKKWRELFIIDDELISDVKSYPYENQELTLICIDWLKELAKENWNENYCETVEYYNEIRFSYKDKSGYISMATETMYNDIMEDSHRVNFVSFNEEFYADELDEDFYIQKNYSGLEECMWCGSFNNYFESEGTVLCEECYEVERCDCCGCDCDELFELDGEYYCEDCYAENAQRDFITGEEHHINSFMRVYVLPKEVVAEDYDKTSLNLGNYCSFLVQEDTESSQYADMFKPYNEDGDEYIRYFRRATWGIRWHYIVPEQIKDIEDFLDNISEDYCEDYDKEDLFTIKKED